MKIKRINYPTDLGRIQDPYNDNIDVFVETDCGYNFTLTVSTPDFYNSYMDKEHLDYIPASPPDVIVKKLTNDNIISAIKSYCEENDGYWLKIYYLLGIKDGIFSKDNLDIMVKKYM